MGQKAGQNYVPSLGTQGWQKQVGIAHRPQAQEGIAHYPHWHSQTELTDWREKANEVEVGKLWGRLGSINSETELSKSMNGRSQVFKHSKDYKGGKLQWWNK